MAMVYVELAFLREGGVSRRYEILPRQLSNTSKNLNDKTVQLDNGSATAPPLTSHKNSLSGCF